MSLHNACGRVAEMRHEERRRGKVERKAEKLLPGLAGLVCFPLGSSVLSSGLTQ